MPRPPWAPFDRLWPLLTGLGVGGILLLVLVLVAEISSMGLAGESAAIVLVFGYATTALGPFLAGLIRDLSGGFRTAMLVLPVVAAAMLLVTVAMSRSSARSVD